MDVAFESGHKKSGRRSAQRKSPSRSLRHGEVRVSGFMEGGVPFYREGPKASMWNLDMVLHLQCHCVFVAISIFNTEKPFSTK